MLLVVHAALLISFLVLGVAFGPFTKPDATIAVVAGMLGVAAMATQNPMVERWVKSGPKAPPQN